MNSIKFIKKEINLVKTQTDNLIADIESNLWSYNPKIINTNLNWQIGHIFLANYLHGIASINGINEDIRNMINVQDYIKFYGMKSNPLENEREKPSKEELLKIYEFGFEIINQGLDKLNELDLDKPTEIPNPAVKTKYQALMWLFKHQSWHNGQIAMLKRILNEKRV